MSNGITYKGVAFAYDTAYDIALVRINRKPNLAPFAAAVAGDASVLHPGDLVMCAGSTKGWPFSFTKGIISSHNRTYKSLRDRSAHGNMYLQSDCGAAEGNSGGPLVNLNGEVVGVYVAGEGPGISFAIRVDTALRALKKMGFEGSFSFNRAKGPSGGNSSLPNSRRKPSTHNK